jgi:hypothetical protein
MIEREHHGESQANGSCANPKSLTAPPRCFQTRCHNVTTSLRQLEVADSWEPRLRYPFSEVQVRLKVVSRTIRLFLSRIARVGNDTSCRLGSLRPVLGAMKSTWDFLSVSSDAIDSKIRQTGENEFASA